MKSYYICSLNKRKMDSSSDKTESNILNLILKIACISIAAITVIILAPFIFIALSIRYTSKRSIEVLIRFFEFILLLITPRKRYNLQKIHINIREILIESIKELEKKNSTTDNIKEKTNKDINNSILYLCCKYLINKTNYFSNNLDVVFKKFNLFIIISMSLWFVIKDEITKTIFTFINNDYISKSKITNTPFFILIIMLLLCIAYFYPKYKREYVYSNKAITIYSCITVIFLYYKLNNIEQFESPFIETSSTSKYILLYTTSIVILLRQHKTYDILGIILISIPFITGVATLLDIILIIYLSVITITLKKHYLFLKTYHIYHSYNRKNTLLLGEVLENKDEEEDILDYNDIAKQLARQICKINNNKSFAIGITKHWGNGKSTFLNFLKTHIDKNNRSSIIIDFSPWYCKSEIDIINLFFNTLAENLKHHHRSLNNEISKYAKQILALKKNTLTEYLAKGFSFLSDSTDIKDIYDRINKNIGSLNKKVYIIIDDIDRLQAKEILECLKIIRNTANFQNIVFIVAYDPIYVDRAIKEGLNNNTKGYMDKIIQLPFELPEIEAYKLHNYMSIEIKKHLREYYPSKNHTSNEELEEIVSTIMNPSYKERPPIEMTQYNIYDSRQNVPLYITNYVNNIRDCNKILNQFFTYHYLLKEEVELDDLLLVCIFKTIYPIEAKIIYNKLGEYISKDPYNPYFKEEEREYKISSISDNIVIHDIIDAIFCKESSSVKRAAINEYYKIYYNGVISRMIITPSKFMYTIKNISQIIDTINTMKSYKSEEGIAKYNDFAFKLSKYSPKSKEEAVTITYGLLYLEENINGYNFSSTIDIILKSYNNNAIYILRKVIELNTNINLIQISTFIKGIKESIIYGNNSRIPGIKLDDIQPLSIKLLKLKIEENIFDNELFIIYWHCWTGVENNMTLVPSDANNLMRSFAEENPLIYIKSLEVPYSISFDENMKSFEPSIALTFSNKIDDYEPFERFLNKTISENPTNKDLNKINEFWLEYRGNNYKYYKNRF